MFAGATKGEGTPAVKKILRNPAAIALILRTPRHGVLFIEAMNPFTPLPRHPLGVFSFESIRITST